MSKVVILMGSSSDRDHCKKIALKLEDFGIAVTMRVASAHKVPLRALDVLREHEGPETVFITVAGRSNALSGFTDANTFCPVIACPPYSDKFSGADLFSSIRMPSGVAPMLVLEPGEAALAAAKILAASDETLREKVRLFQEKKRSELEEADAAVSQGSLMRPE